MVLLADLENHARGQSKVFVGTPGSVLERSNAAGFRFYAHQFYDGDGKKRERYLAGPVGAPEADAMAQALRLAIAETKAASTSLRLLGREGFALADAKTYATLASLYNHGVFQAGGVLIGSHAYGLLLNQLGVAGAPYATEDIDIARREKLAFPELPEASFLEMLQSTGIPFVEVPQLDARQPSTSFKERGRSRFHVDLLVPSAGEDFQVVPVPELQAHATALPYLSYLLADSQMSLLMAREGCCMVRVPLPERFALHKLMVSQLRHKSRGQIGKGPLPGRGASCRAWRKASRCHRGGIATGSLVHPWSFAVCRWPGTAPVGERSRPCLGRTQPGIVAAQFAECPTRRAQLVWSGVGLLAIAGRGIHILPERIGDGGSCTSSSNGSKPRSSAKRLAVCAVGSAHPHCVTHRTDGYSPAH
jgi:hypothetical protein